MHYANSTNEMLPVGNEPGPGSSNPITLLHWAPAFLLVAAVAAISILGKPDSANSELRWLEQLSNAGDPGAELQLGVAYRDGLYGLKPDAKTGLYWLKQSANAGNAYAEDAVGVAYAEGQGTQPNNELANQWWRKAMQNGNQSARVHLSEAMIAAGHVQQAEQLLMTGEEK
jgi:TPR repeat protein